MGKILRGVWDVNLEADGVWRIGGGQVLQLFDGADGDKFGEIDVADAAAALGLVHVMGGDEEGDALAG